MRRVIKLNQEVVERLKCIKKNIKLYGATNMCPWWGVWAIDIDGVNKSPCVICKELFPKVPTFYKEGCPYRNYKPKYLIRRLNEIIKYNEELSK